MASSPHLERDIGVEPGSVEGLHLGRRDVAERLVQTGVVEPADVLDDGELELRAGAPDAVGDELGLEAVDEALGQRVEASYVKSRVRASLRRAPLTTRPPVQSSAEPPKS